MILSCLVNIGTVVFLVCRVISQGYVIKGSCNIGIEVTMGVEVVEI